MDRPLKNPNVLMQVRGICPRGQLADIRLTYSCNQCSPPYPVASLNNSLYQWTIGRTNLSISQYNTLPPGRRHDFLLHKLECGCDPANGSAIFLFIEATLDCQFVISNTADLVCGNTTNPCKNGGRCTENLCKCKEGWESLDCSTGFLFVCFY